MYIDKQLLLLDDKTLTTRSEYSVSKITYRQIRRRSVLYCTVRRNLTECDTVVIERVATIATESDRHAIIQHLMPHTFILVLSSLVFCCLTMT